MPCECGVDVIRAAMAELAGCIGVRIRTSTLEWRLAMSKRFAGRCIAVLFLLVTLSAVAAPPPSEPMRLYDEVQSLRQRAGKFSDAEHPTAADLAEAERLLDSAVALIDEPKTRELADGNPYLWWRRYDVMRDLAAVEARQGRTEQALDALDVMQAQGWIPHVAEELRGTDFASLRDEPRFKTILATLDATQRLWAGDAFAAPYRESLDEAERVAGLSLFWSEARHAFAHFDHVPELDWNRAYRDFLPQVAAANNTRDYYVVLMRFAALLHDGHTNVYPPEALEDRFYARPPLRTALVEGKVLVTALRSPSLAQLGVHVGDEIVAIDGEPVREYGERRIAPTVSSSTPQDRDVRVYGYELLMGDADASVRLSVRDARDRTRELIVPRKGYDDVVAPKAFELHRLPGGVVALTLDHFESDAAVKAFEAAWPVIRHAKGLILDVRGNGGGSSNYGYEILSRLGHAPVPTSRQSAAWIDPVRRARAGAVVEWRPQPGSGESWRREHAEIYDGPVAVLIGPRTFSAAEDFVVSFDAMKRGILVGEATAGSTGQPLFFKLPGGGSARICVKRDSYPDGREFVGKGIAPTIEVAPTVADVRAHRDAALERARRELLKSAAR